MSEAVKLDWFPLYFQRLKASAAWKMMDYQCGWYGKLLIELADSDVPGYLPNNAELWKLAGAKTERFFQNNGGPELLADHFNRTDDELWIYNSRLLNVLHEQGTRLSDKRRRRTASLSVGLQEVPDWVPGEVFGDYLEMRKSIKKEIKTAHALKLAINTLEKLKALGYEPQKVLEQSIFRSWAGLFPIEVTNGNGRGKNLEGRATGANGATPITHSPEQENCSICKGSGWDLRTGKAARCDCRKQKLSAIGATAGR